MVSHALLVRLKAQSSQITEVEQFLRAAAPQLQAEPATAVGFALRLSRNEYGMFDAFSSEGGRVAHLDGMVANALVAEAPRLLDGRPQVLPLEIVASKMPERMPPDSATCGLLLGFDAKKGSELKAEQFLRDAYQIAMEEPGTMAWFAMRWPDGGYGIFSAFPDHAARLAHMTGHVPRELTKQALKLLGGLPSMETFDVLATHLAERDTLVGLGVD
jgi:quinol monooxygenase YgiN